MKSTFAILLFCLCTGLYAQVNVKIETLFTLNDEKTTKKEYMFYGISGIITDKDNNFYVYHNMGTEIKKFSKEGKYIRTIGRSGSGPGEIKHIDFLYLDAKNQFLLFDQMNGRDTYYDLDGRYLRAIPAIWATHPYNRVMKFDYTSYITIKSVNDYQLKHGNKLLICDNETHKELTSFGYSSIFWKYNDVFEKHMDDSNALNLVVSNDKVYVTRECYDGKIFIFDKSKNWEVKIVEGRQIKKPGYEIYAWRGSSNSNIPKLPYSLVFGTYWQGAHKVFSIFVKYKSMGLFVYKNRYLLNFIVRYIKDKEFECGIDVYKLDGTYIGYSQINDFKCGSVSDKILCKDNEDNFYYASSRGSLKKIRLTIN